MLRWAILGTGFISHTVIDAIRRSDASRVEIVAGRSIGRVDEFQRAHEIERGSIDFDAVLADPEIDAVYIGTPNHQHHPFAIAASEAGKAVLCEKSLTTSMESAVRLADAVRANGTFFLEGLMYLAHPIMQAFVQAVGDGRLGRIRSITGRYGAAISDVVNPEGRGTIYNLGCYPASLLHLVVQTAFGAEAFTQRTIHGLGTCHVENGTVTDAGLVVQFDAGVLATLQSSDNYGSASDFSVAGDHGVLRFETNPWLPIAGRNALHWLPYDAGAQAIVVDDAYDAFFHQIKLVERCVAAGRVEAPRPSPRLADSLEIMELLTEWEALCLG